MRWNRWMGAAELAVWTLALILAAQPASAQNSAQVAKAIRARLETAPAGAAALVAGERVVLSNTLIEVYEQAAFGPLWTDPTARAELLRTIDDLPEDGLDPASYHRGAVAREAFPGDAGAAADLDLLRTSALLEILHDLRVGRARPPLPGIGAEFARAESAIDPSALRAIIAAGWIHDEIARFRPTHFVYRGLRAGLARLRGIAASGGWGTIPSGPALFRDTADARIPSLRRRLSAEGYAAADSGLATEFDAPLERAIVSFQHHHGLNEDGVVGARTQAELNVPVAARIDQVRINLERSRWLNAELPPRFIVVNTAGAKVYMVDGAQVVFETRTIVGKMYTKTPVFSGTLRTVELDPTWTVPPSIVKEILAEVRKDPGYLARQQILVLDARGRSVDPGAIDLAHAKASSFPYTFRQQPGPTNPLGRIKLLFPNGYNVYLHDTPSRSLFEREERTFSHGCIRVADPFGLAELVLDQPSLWSRAALEQATGTDSTRVLRVPRPTPVLVYYWTASADERAELHFYRDTYGRDAAVLRVIGTTPHHEATREGDTSPTGRQGELPTVVQRNRPTEPANPGAYPSVVRAKAGSTHGRLE